MNRIVRYADVKPKFLPAAFLYSVAVLACAAGFAHAIARAQGTPAGELPRRGFAGVQVGPVPEDARARLKLAAAQGLLVSRVVAGGAAAEAGLAEGDVLANFRRQTLLARTPYDELERRARRARACKQRLLLEKQTPEQILKDAPACSEYLESPAPYTYMQQLADLNLAEVWKKVEAPALIIYGTSDFLTSAAEHEYLRDLVNSFRPGTAAYVEIEGMAHGFERAASQRESYESRSGGARPEFNTQVFDETLRWLTAAAGTT